MTTVDSASTPSAPTAEQADERAYLYGIVAAGSDLAGLTGLAGRLPLRVVESGPVAAVYSALPADFAAPDALDEHALAQLVTAHDEVLRSIAARTTVLPVRFGVATTQPARLARALRAEADRLAEQLAAVAGCSEWGVQIELVADPPGGAGRARPPDAAMTSGAQYLRSRKEAIADDTSARRLLAEYARGVESDLGGAGATSAVDLSTDSRRIFNSSYLVPDAQSDAFVEAARRHHAAVTRLGGMLRITGPWIAYSFTEISLPEVRDD